MADIGERFPQADYEGTLLDGAAPQLRTKIQRLMTKMVKRWLMAVKLMVY